MKKVLASGAVLLLFAGCAAELDNNNIISNNGEALKVSFEQPVTRAQFDANEQTVWNEGDEVAVFFNQNVLEQWSYTGAEGATAGTIERGQVLQGDDITGSVIIYPYSESYAIDEDMEDMLLMNIPATQYYKENSFGGNGNIMVAYSADNSKFVMKSIVGWLKLQLVGDCTVGSIVLKGNNQEMLAGMARVNYNDASLVLFGTPQITLDCGAAGVALDPAVAKNFYIAVPPTNFANGVTVDILDVNGELIKSQTTNNAVAVARKTIQPLAQLEVAAAPLVPAISSIENTASKDESGVINLVAKWDSSLNGKITKVTYVLRANDWSIVAGDALIDDTPTSEMVVSADKAEVKIEGLAPGSGPYWPVLQAFTTTGAGELVYLPSGEPGLYAGGTYAGPKAIMDFGVEQVGDRVVRINVVWDTNLFPADNTIDFVGYKVATRSWVEVVKGGFTTYNAEAGTASVEITLPAAYDYGNYILGLYLDKTNPDGWCAGMDVAYNGSDPLYKKQYLQFPAPQN